MLLCDQEEELQRRHNDVSPITMSSLSAIPQVSRDTAVINYYSDDPRTGHGRCSGLKTVVREQGNTLFAFKQDHMAHDFQLKLTH